MRAAVTRRARLAGAVAFTAALSVLGGCATNDGADSPQAKASESTVTPTVTPTVVPSGTAGPVPVFPVTPTAAQKKLLDTAVGFGAGVTGGAGGRTVTVSSAADSGPGSLRAAVSGNAPKWVVFDRDLTIRLRTPITVGSNTTIDGRGREVTLIGGAVSGLMIHDVSNVVVESLTLQSFGAQDTRKAKGDAINVNRATGVWIDHNSLSQAGDKVIVLVAARGVTVSWNRVSDQDEVMQIGNMKFAKESLRSTVTLHHNLFEDVGFRVPEVAYARAHVYNNVYLRWDEVAVRSERLAQVVLERNVLVGRGSDSVTTVTRPAGGGCNSKGECDPREGLLRAVGNDVRSARKIDQAEPSKVFDPALFYSYLPTTAGDGLVAAVRKGVGPR